MAAPGLLLLSAVAQEGVPATAVSAQLIESRINEVQASTTLDEEARNRLIEDYRRALGFIESARAYAEKAESFARAGKSAPEETRIIREQLEQQQAGPAAIKIDIPADASAENIDASLQTEQANQAAVATKLVTLEQQLSVGLNRPRIVRERLVEAGQLVDKLAADFNALSVPDQSPMVEEARRWVLSAQAVATNAEIQMLDQELLSRPMRVALLQAQRDLSEQNLRRIEERVLLLEERLADQRRSETQQIIADSDTAVFGAIAKHPLIRAAAKEQVELRQYLESLTDDLETAEEEERTAIEELAKVQKNFQSAQQRLEIAGLNQVLGQVLHDQRQNLPDLRNYRKRSQKRAEAIAQTGLRDLQMEAEWSELQDIKKYVAGYLAAVTEAERTELTGPLEEIFTGRRVLLKNAITANSNYLRVLGELDFQESQLLATANEFNDFLVQRLLWVRNKEAIGFKTAAVLPTEVIEFIAPKPWLEASQVLLANLVTEPLLWLILLIVGGLFWKKPALHKALSATAKYVGRPVKDSFIDTARAMGFTVLLALPWPLLSLTAGWVLSQSLDASDGAKAIGVGLFSVTRFLFFLSVFRALCTRGGLAEAHFKWPASATRALRLQLNQLVLTFLLPAFVLVIVIEIDPENFGGELSRILFVIATGGLLIFLARSLRPQTGLLDTLLNAQGHGKPISWLWLVLGTTVPVAYAVAALAGYLYSAITLMSLLIHTLWLLLFLVITHQLASRWLLVVGGRLQLKVIRERRAAEYALRVRQQEGSGETVDSLVVPEEEEIDVAGIDTDTRKLLSLSLLVIAFIGMGAIWSRVLPALTVLNKFVLWEYLDGPAGQQELLSVTLADILLAAAYIFIAVVATRTVPSLIEAILRQRNTTPGTRLAVATLARYSIVLVSVALVASAIGFNWGKIQWLVAALGVGIGFGLQEIIANFISGLIILAERPIRVGDLVTVGDTSGTVTRLQIRATTVTNFDRQELLVPNKEFITGRVLNWSLSDEVIRLVINVGVAYGTDMVKALALVTEAVAEHQSVLNDPAPLITFDSFGDNSLNIIARCFIASLKKRREIISDINLAINQKFNAAGIVIAFPQRDIHLDTSSPLDIRIQHSGGPEAPAPAKPEA